MSMIKNQISALRELAELQNISYHKSIINCAADTIETLSAKLADMERPVEDCGGWIPCKDRLPDGGGMYIVTAVENGLYHTTFAKWQSRYKEWDLRGCRSHWKVIAWQPLPEPYHEP